MNLTYLNEINSYIFTLHCGAQCPKKKNKTLGISFTFPKEHLDESERDWKLCHMFPLINLKNRFAHFLE
jgi:hypothetical protein